MIQDPAPVPVRYLPHPATRQAASPTVTAWFDSRIVTRWAPADRFALPPGPQPATALGPPAPEPARINPPLAPLQLADVAPGRASAEPHLWSAVPVQDEPTPGKRRRLAALPLALGGVALLAAGIAAAVLLPGAFASRPAVIGLFNAPMMVLRAASAGRITDLGVGTGQTVDPATRLLTIHTDPPPDPAPAALQSRLDAARARLTALDAAPVQPMPANEAGRARVADLRQQRAAAASDLTTAQDAVTRYTPKDGADWPVLAGIHGIVRSLETQAGADIASGTPLVRLLDCDHAFLTLPEGAELRAGQQVGIRLPLFPPVLATVRASSGNAEPRDSLVVPLSQAALDGACPVGAAGTVVPASELGRDRRS